MFTIRGISKFKVMKTYVRERRKMFDPQLLSYEETLVQAICWSDPYAMMTITNSPSSLCRSVVSRLLGDLFFDQQAHIFAHSSDFISLILLIVILQLKKDAERLHI
jgi:hypothetical protein